METGESGALDPSTAGSGSSPLSTQQILGLGQLGLGSIKKNPITPYQPGSSYQAASGGIDKGALLKSGGQVLGAAFGGPEGASIGGSAGSMLGDKVSPDLMQEKPQETAMSRRFNSLNDDNLAVLRDSLDSLQYIPDDQKRASLAEPLMQAYYMEVKKRGGTLG